ncbi:MATE family efflux transporter [Saccharobesus litoralis]|uniref:MATE family efflux transporter n=1 Tax=Saccharobesus litoralis TaxID=2172099 RepID=A0A2S0VPI3_9ALTE|nr:MATE family efflux transporter [Saccharobesus litoralis]AWB66131.1 MATE family efflux transporter [Saccharobesus litoralis]
MSTHNPALTGRIVSTFFYYVLPSVIGLIAITSANLIDGFFVGNAVGANALAAITLMVPLFTLLIAIAIMLAIGGAVSAGKAIGEDDTHTASDIFSQSLIAAATINLLFALISLVFESQLFALLNIPESIQPLAKEYFGIIRWVFILQLTTMVLYYFVRADGHPILATSALVTGAALNIALDAWFILYLDMGLAGAAWATAIAQTVQFLVLSRYFLSRQRTLKFNLVQGRWHLLRQSAYNGLSEFIGEISVGIIFFILNALLIARLGVDGVAAFTLVNYFIFLSIMMSYGLADALHLVISQNYGAQYLKRVHQFLSTAIASSISLGLFIVTVLTFWPSTILAWFVSEQEQQIAQVSSQLIPLLLPLFLINGTNIVLTCYLTAIHQPKPSALIAISRGLILPAGLLVLLYYWMPIWLPVPNPINDFSFIIAFPLAEWCAFILAGYFCYQYRPNNLRQPSRCKS